MMNLLRRSRLVVKLSLGFRSLSNSSCSYDLTKFTKQYNHLINNKDTPLLVNHDNGSFQMLTSTCLRGGSDAMIKTPPVYVKFPRDFVVCGPCHGLFCLYSADGEVVLWNPGTGDTKSLTGGDVRLNQTIKTRNVGFGFDSKANDYKIVRSISRFFVNPLYNSVEEIIDQVEVYSLKTKQWREIPVHGERSTTYLPWLSAGSFADGACYWSIKPDPNELDDDLSKRAVRLISFDFEEEEFNLHTLDLAKVSPYCSPHMDRFDGCPAVICNDLSDIHVWKGRRNGGGVVTWDYEMNIGSRSIVAELSPLCFWENKGLILLGEEYLLHLYDFETEKFYESGVFLQSHRPRSDTRKLQLLSFPDILVPNVW